MAWRAISSCALAVNASASASNVVDSAWASNARTLSRTGSLMAGSRSAIDRVLGAPGGGMMVRSRPAP